MTLCVTFSLVAGIVWVSSDSAEDTQAVAARGSDAAGGGGSRSDGHRTNQRSTCPPRTPPWCPPAP
ncbi:hypothetical protein Smic_73430 [Streptomyces microflavus]|uniref:Uncharacterized protein n=1 Tax=Streptomyces microflavus TaxID=1919 RepID=A0A7J0D3Z0_STRMI|nr:hypothetical protein Smic_73430 [Streptomyces microflavus]